MLRIRRLPACKGFGKYDGLKFEKGHILNAWRWKKGMALGKRAWRPEKGHGARKKGHGAAPCYFALDLTLAVSKAFSSVNMIDNTDELLTGLFKYYHYSTVRSESLEAIQNFLRETGDLESQNNLSMKRAIHTRWLSHEASVQTVRKLYEPIIIDLENAVASGRDKTVKENKGIPAASLLKMMKTYHKLYFIHLLCDVCTCLASLTRTFEKEDVD